MTQAQDASRAFPGVWDTVGTFTAAGSPSALLDPTTGVIEVVARGTDGAIHSTGETVQGSGTWRDWTTATQVGDIAATDPTTFAFTTGSATTWAFVFRRSDNTVRVYTENDLGAAFAGLARPSGPAFSARTMPTPPNR
ncbi:MAG TPA: hypothetical protein VFX70_15740 [Mycobacteriales bacterium]|nr:hypothetical protein [Mycobacteriales bacterium]